MKSPMWVIIFMLVGAGGCSTSPYLTDRRRDAADVFTATIGTGGGLKAKVGPIYVAAEKNSDLAGLRCGEWFANGNDLVYNDEMYAPLPLPPREGIYDELSDIYFGGEQFSLGLGSPAALRSKAVLSYSPFPFYARSINAPPYTQIEVVGGILLTVRFGINPGELLDFVLGWAGVDLYHDDIAANPPKSEDLTAPRKKIPPPTSVWKPVKREKP